MMNTNLSIALLFLAVSEITAIGVSFIPNPDEFQIAIGLIQLIGVFFWVEGCLLYLYFANHVLEFSDRRLIIPLILVLASLPYLGIETILLILTASLSNKVVITVPLEIFLTSILLSQIIILWYFRKGHLARPVGLGILGNASLLARTILWTITAVTLTHPVLQITAAVGYWFLGVSLVLMKKSEDILDDI